MNEIPKALPEVGEWWRKYCRIVKGTHSSYGGDERMRVLDWNGKREGEVVLVHYFVKGLDRIFFLLLLRK